MADDPRLAALAAAILPWVVMPTGGGRYAGADWTPAEQAAYDAAGGWGAGIDAARRVRAERAARDALAALDGPAAALLAQDQHLSEVDTLRAAAHQFERAAAAWRAEGLHPQAERNQYAADVLATWATNGGLVPRFGPETRAALADQQADSDV